MTFERFLEATGNHKRVNLLYDPSHFVLQQLDYIAYIDPYHEFIKMFHVKDAEFNPTGKKGSFGGYANGKTGQDATGILEMERLILKRYLPS